MGCGASRPDEVSSKPVALLRDRVDLIRAAADARFALAASHAAYSRALRAVGEALERFVREELAVADVSPPGSPVLTIPSSDGKGKGKGKRKGDKSGKSPDEDGSTISTGEGSHLHLSDDSHLPLSDDSHIHFDDDEDDSHIPLSPSASDDDQAHIEEKPVGQTSKQGIMHSWSPLSQVSASPYPHPGAGPIPNYYYMKRSPAIPTTVYQQPQPPYAEYGYSYPPPPTYGAGSSSATGAPDIYPSYYGYYERPVMNSPPPTKAPTPPPPPPQPEGSAWDFLDPFTTYEQVYRRYSLRSSPSSPSSTEVREKEGIPDLEEETEAEMFSSRDVKNVTAKRKKAATGESSGTKASAADGGSSKASASKMASPEGSGGKKGSAGGKGGVESSKSPPSQKDSAKEKQLSEEECIASPESSSKHSSSLAEDDSYKKKGVTFDVETSLETDKSEISLAVALSVPGTKDVREVVDEIKEQFMVAAGSGEELWPLLEVGRLRYRSRKTVFRVVSSRIFTSLPKLTRSRLSVKHSRFSPSVTFRMVKLSRRNMDYLNGRSGDLSWTLETLYAWEKKLYREVKSEEKLRFAYDKKYKHLTKLTDRGEDYDKVEYARASVRALSMKIDVAIKTIETISRSIQKLRDDKLQKQLVALVQGLIRMWNSMIDCHQKQLRAIVDSKTRNLMAKTGTERNSVATATKDLEREVNNWLVCFDDWISSQRSYVEALHRWLLGWLNVEPEITADGIVPFSPGRIGAPAVFIICSDWYQATNRISDNAVNASIQDFAERLHLLWEIQIAEQYHKRKAEYLSKDFSRRHSALREAGILQLEGSDTKSSVVDKNAPSADERLVALESLRKRLDEEKAKHGEAAKQLHEFVSNSLKVGLVPVFHALGSFTWETLKAYEGIRLPVSSRSLEA